MRRLTQNSRSERPKDRARAGREGFTLIELLLVVSIILIISAIAIPSLIRSKMAANEAAASAGIHAILTASSLYYEDFSNGYPPDMATMAGPPGGLPTCDQAQELEALMANAPNQKNGYTYGYTGENGNTNPVVGCTKPGWLGFLATAVPIKVGVTGARSFCVTEEGGIHFDSSGAPIATEAACDALPSLQ